MVFFILAAQIVFVLVGGIKHFGYGVTQILDIFVIDEYIADAVRLFQILPAQGCKA